GNDLQYGELQEVIDGNPMKAVSSIQLEMYNKDNEAVGTINSILDQVLESNGSLRALIEAYGHGVSTEDPNYPVGDYPMMLKQLNELAYDFAQAFNEIHRQGYDLDGVGNTTNGGDFFTIGSNSFDYASEIKVEEYLIENPNKIRASDSWGSNPSSGNGLNAQKLAEIIMNGNSSNDSIKASYESIIGTLGVDAQQANRMADNTAVLRSQVENQRMSVSAVSLDEEMSNLLKFQHAYNAAARSLTAIDELIDRVINNMGLVGR